MTLEEHKRFSEKYIQQQRQRLTMLEDQLAILEDEKEKQDILEKTKKGREDLVVFPHVDWEAET